MAYLTPADLAAFADIDEAKALAMIEDAEASAALAAPCITDPLFLDDDALTAGVRSILRGAILRWEESGTGALAQVGAGSFQQSIDTRQPRRGMFWPSELSQLRELCSRFNNAGDRKAFAIDTAPTLASDDIENYPAYWFQWVHPTPPNAP